MKKKIVSNLKYGSKFIASDITIKTFEVDIDRLLQSNTLLSRVEDIKAIYLNEIVNIQVIPLCSHRLYKIAEKIKCDLLHVIISSPVDSLSFEKFDAINNIMYKYLVLTGQADSVIYSVVDSVSSSILIVQLTETKASSDDIDNSPVSFKFPEFKRDGGNGIKYGDSINQLMTALANKPEGTFNLSWVQRNLGWGYHRALNVVRHLSEKKLLAVLNIEEPNPIIVHSL